MISTWRVYCDSEHFIYRKKVNERVNWAFANWAWVFQLIVAFVPFALNKVFFFSPSASFCLFCDRRVISRSNSPTTARFAATELGSSDDDESGRKEEKKISRMTWGKTEKWKSQHLLAASSRHRVAAGFSASLSMSSSRHSIKRDQTFLINNELATLFKQPGYTNESLQRNIKRIFRSFSMHSPRQRIASAYLIEQSRYQEKHDYIPTDFLIFFFTIIFL